MTDLITVVYKDEVDLLQHQIYTIDKFAHGFNKHFIIINDNTTLHLDKKSNNIEIYNYQDIGIPEFGTGWDRQQLCKLIATTLSDQPHCIILDSKTFFTESVSPKTFISDKIVCNIGSMPQVFAESYKWLHEFFNIEYSSDAITVNTPFVFITNEVKSMINYFDNFIDWYVQYCLYPTLITEFGLYNAWIKKQHGTIDKLYKNFESHQVVGLNISHFEAGFFEKILKESWTASRYANIHKEVMIQLNRKQSELLKKFLEHKNLDCNYLENYLKY